MTKNNTADNTAKKTDDKKIRLAPAGARSIEQAARDTLLDLLAQLFGGAAPGHDEKLAIMFMAALETYIEQRLRKAPEPV